MKGGEIMDKEDLKDVLTNIYENKYNRKRRASKAKAIVRLNRSTASSPSSVSKKYQIMFNNIINEDQIAARKDLIVNQNGIY
jgi:hypothetical protein